MSVPQRNITAQEADALEHAPGRERENLEGWIPPLASDEEVRAALEKAFDYRGDITITLKTGDKIEGYIFDRRTGHSGQRRGDLDEQRRPDDKARTPHMNESPKDPTVITQRLRLATGFLSSERDWIVRRLAALGSRLRSFPDTQVELEISLKERHGTDQRVTLECWISRTPPPAPGVHVIRAGDWRCHQ